MIAAESAATPVPVGRDPVFRRLLRASSVSMLGSHVTSIAYPLLVLRLTNSPVEAGWVAFAAIAPSLLVHVPAGALVDRRDPLRAMLVSEIGRGMAIAAVAVMLVMGKPNVPLLTAAAVVEGVLGVFSTLAERRCVGSIVRPEQVPAALVRLEGRNHVVLLVGRPLGGLLFGIEPILPFLADVATFIYSVAALAGIKSRWPVAARRTEASREPAPGSRLGIDIWNGLRRMGADRYARTVIIAFSIGTLSDRIGTRNVQSGRSPIKRGWRREGARSELANGAATGPRGAAGPHNPEERSPLLSELCWPHRVSAARSGRQQHRGCSAESDIRG